MIPFLDVSRDLVLVVRGDGQKRIEGLVGEQGT